MEAEARRLFISRPVTDLHSQVEERAPGVAFDIEIIDPPRARIPDPQGFREQAAGDVWVTLVAKREGVVGETGRQSRVVFGKAGARELERIGPWPRRINDALNRRQLRRAFLLELPGGVGRRPTGRGQGREVQIVNHRDKPS